jgi:predicted nucleic-acid-binding protein
MLVSSVKSRAAMNAVDTNVLVRLLTGDDHAEEQAAKSLFAAESVWIAKTVLLETGWVLASVFGYDESAIRDAILSLLGLDGVHVEDRTGVAAALALVEHGVQFADALNLSSRPSDAVFVSFDKDLIRRAQRAGVSGVRGLSASSK